MTLQYSRSKWKPSFSSCFVFALVACGMLGGTQAAKAASIIEFSLNGGSTFLPANQFSASGDSVATWSGIFPSETTIGNFNVEAAMQGNSPGTAPQSKILTSTLDLLNNTGSTQTIVVAFGQTGFTLPVSATSSIFMNSHVGGSVVTGSSLNTMSFESYVDQSNGLGHLGVPGTFNTNAQTPTITTGSFDSDASKNIGPLAANYSITQYVTITLGAGAEINFSANTTLSQDATIETLGSAPEPASMTLLGIGIAGLAGYGWRRRKQAATA
jgi:hypothetical protein